MGPATGPAVDARVMGVVVVGAVAGARVRPPVGVGPGRRDDHVLGVAVGGLVGVAEVHSRGLGLGGQLVAGQPRGLLGGGRGRAVVPDPGSTPPVGWGIGLSPWVQVVAPTGAPSQYWVMTPLHDSPSVPRPAYSVWSAGASAVGVAAEDGPAGAVGRLGAPLAAHEHQVDLRLPGGHAGRGQATGGQAAAVGSLEASRSSACARSVTRGAGRGPAQRHAPDSPGATGGPHRGGTSWWSAVGSVSVTGDGGAVPAPATDAGATSAGPGDATQHHGGGHGRPTRRRCRDGAMACGTCGPPMRRLTPSRTAPRTGVQVAAGPCNSVRIPVRTARTRSG